MFTMFATNVFASTAEYYTDGTPSKITTDKGTINYYTDGTVKSIVTTGGTATYKTDGSIDSIVGTPSITLDEAKAEFNKLKTSSPSITNTTKQATSSMPNTGVENTYMFLIPVLAGVILFSAIKLGKLNNK